MPAPRFDYGLDYNKIDFRKDPSLYRTGIGEQGVLLVQPYKSEILPLWKFKTPALAKESAAAIYRSFLAFAKANDFVGMDMARKFLQMGYTRSRRYANHRSGKKYSGPVPQDKKGMSGAHGREQLPLDPDDEKARSAAIFFEAWQKVKKHSKYKVLMAGHKAQYSN